MTKSVRHVLANGGAIIALGAVLVAPLAAQSGAQMDARIEAKGDWKAFPKAPQAPAGAPNVLLIMTDDVGFAAPSTFGGPIATPALDDLARRGLLYNQFHTTAMCSPSRAALLTGRNHHAVNFGVVSFVSTDDPGYTSVIPDSAATIADVLRANGYSTAMIGKNHNTPLWEDTPIGPYDHWPLGLGFDYFYGFNMSMADQFSPALTENLTAVDPPKKPGYFLERDFADHAIVWLRQQRTIYPDKPFFLYYATGATHWPEQAPKDWIARFAGKFDEGWDKLREETFARQKAKGIIPADADLAQRPKDNPAWDTLTPEQQKVAERLMEVYAAMLAYTDAQIQRVMDELRTSGQLDNTLVVFVSGDNGASGEFMEGTMNGLANFVGTAMGQTDMAKHMDMLGGPDTWGSYPAGWASAMNTPFPWVKTIASHLGGTRNGLVVSWPERIHEKGQVRSQFHHLIDVMPTILDAVGIKLPVEFGGVKQQPIEGVSMTYTFDHPNAPSRHLTQYFEMLGNRAFYDRGWMASTTPEKLPWNEEAEVPQNLAPTYKWELYNLAEDYSQTHNLADKYPKKLRELQRGFDAIARKDNVYPLSDNYIARVNPSLRPNNLAGRTSFTYYPGPTRYTGGSFPGLGKNWHLVADLDLAEQPADEAVIVRGNQLGGWGLFIQDARPRFVMRATQLPEDVTSITGEPLSSGKHTVSVKITAAGGGKSSVTLIVDGVEAGKATTTRGGFMGGDVYVGRSGQAPLIKGVPMTEVSESSVDSVHVEVDQGK